MTPRSPSFFFPSRKLPSLSLSSAQRGPETLAGAPPRPCVATEPLRRGNRVYEVPRHRLHRSPHSIEDEEQGGRRRLQRAAAATPNSGAKIPPVRCFPGSDEA